MGYLTFLHLTHILHRIHSNMTAGLPTRRYDESPHLRPWEWLSWDEPHMLVTGASGLPPRLQIQSPWQGACTWPAVPPRASQNPGSPFCQNLASSGWSESALEALWCSGSEMGFYLRAYTQLCKGLRRRTGSSQCSKMRPGRRCEEDGVRTGTRIQTQGRAGGVQQKPEG